MRISPPVEQESQSAARNAIVTSAPGPATNGGSPASLFRVGDAVFLISVGVESGVVMQAIHRLEWNFLLLSILGMAAAMAVQMMLAFALSPLLGSIETMAPSMVVAMVVPMLLDVGELAGWMIGPSNAALFGATVALLFFAYLQWYEVSFRRQLARRWRIGAKPQ